MQSKLFDCVSPAIPFKLSGGSRCMTKKTRWTGMAVIDGLLQAGEHFLVWNIVRAYAAYSHLVPKWPCFSHRTKIGPFRPADRRSETAERAAPAHQKKQTVFLAILPKLPIRTPCLRCFRGCQLPQNKPGSIQFPTRFS